MNAHYIGSTDLFRLCTCMSFWVMSWELMDLMFYICAKKIKYVYILIGLNDERSQSAFGLASAFAVTPCTLYILDSGQ